MPGLFVLDFLRLGIRLILSQSTSDPGSIKGDHQPVESPACISTGLHTYLDILPFTDGDTGYQLCSAAECTEFVGAKDKSRC